ncbi:hypothetical protein [Alkalicoccobacillus porphyridii]|uniref:Uncharacterized protein n=1 Tax=Alkalicoccobacillus porphyridii TaxID=2597270 RepID=A0A554A093_9BACI|nr:hypothetical protein [Alkalicoccobacillus porphyridii]TSB47112.1 hypothetical protein FN960_08850 [Alkalicoccobacillus porphyridii]
MALTDDELVIKYIKYATARNVMSRKIRVNGSDRMIQISNMIGADIHDLKKELHYKNITIVKAEANASIFYGYTVYKNGWRSEHQMMKSIIQTDVDQIIKEAAAAVDKKLKKK